MNLLSGGQLDRQKRWIVLGGGKVKIFSSISEIVGEVEAVGRLTSAGVYELDNSSSPPLPVKKFSEYPSASSKSSFVSQTSSPGTFADVVKRPGSVGEMRSEARGGRRAERANPSLRGRDPPWRAQILSDARGHPVRAPNPRLTHPSSPKRPPPSAFSNLSVSCWSASTSRTESGLPARMHALAFHLRFGHPGESRMRQLAKLAGVNLYGNIDFCEACARGKVRRAPFRSDAHFRRFGLGECWHADLVGPFRTLLRGKSKYVPFFTEDHSGFVTCRLLSRKSEQLSKLREIVAWSKVQTGKSMRVLRSDGEWN